MKILTGIVTFNPDISRFKENLSHIICQDTDILVFDNGSKSAKEVQRLVSEMDGKLILSAVNKGIAYGLRAIMKYADEHGYDWVLTLDQDSVANKQLIAEYQKYTDDPTVGALTCDIRDRNFIEISGGGEHSLEQVQVCITAGCFMRVSAYRATPGYDSSMFIDYVDFDICYALLRAGYDIVKIPYEGLLHEDGHGMNVSFFGKKYIMYNKAAWRRFYMMRNEVYLARKFPEFQSPFFTVLRCFWHTFLVFLYEDDKASKLRNGLKGIFSGMHMQIHQPD